MKALGSIESRLPDRFARGWHCIGLESQLEPGQLKTLEYFDTRIVIFRGEDGRIRALNGFCPHMGANLGDGAVVGNTVQCPFHQWQWGDGGRCMHIPYHDAIPPAARIDEWPICIENELIYLWHDHEGLPPIPEQAIPRHRSSYEDGWSEWVLISGTAHSNCRELIDNLADASHFSPVHGSPVDSYINASQGHSYCQMLTGGNPLIGGDSLRSIAYYYGPSYVIADMTSVVWGKPIESIMMIGSVPITQNKFVMHFGMKVRALEDLSFAENQKLIREYIEQGQETFFQDLRIWDAKVKVDNPILCGGDGPLLQLRKWYDQFYVDRDQVDPALQSRKIIVTMRRHDTDRWIEEEHGVQMNGARSKTFAPSETFGLRTSLPANTLSAA